MSVRAALFTGNYNHIRDGVSLTLNRMVRYLEAQGHEMLVFGPTVEEPALDHAGTLVPVPSLAAPGRPEYRVSTGFSAEAKRAFDDFAPDLVHIATPDVLGLGALRYAKKRGLPVVATYHTHFSSYLDYYRLGWAEPMVWRYLRWFYRHCRHLYVPTESMAAELRRHGIDGNLRIWARGVEVDTFNPSKRDLSWRRALGIEDDEPVVAFVSRIVWEKGLDVYAGVIEALEEAALQHRALIVGDGPALPELKARLPKAISVGFQSGQALARAYASSDIFLFPSETETFGNVTLEAMASGLPAVCADAVGSSSLVLDGNTGFLAPSRDTPAFYEAVRRLVDDPRLRTEQSAAARRHAESFAWEKILAQMDAYYQEAIAL
ncbi:MAG: glycosyltransferase family 1 protein [Bacteroidota bacterium]